MQTSSSLQSLPEECLLLVLARVDLQSLCHVSATSQYLHGVIKVSSNRSIRTLTAVKFQALLLLLMILTVFDIRNHQVTLKWQDPELWRRLAEAKWGHQAISLREGRPTDWQAFCKQRICLRTIRHAARKRNDNNFVLCSVHR